MLHSTHDLRLLLLSLLVMPSLPGCADEPSDADDTGIHGGTESSTDADGQTAASDESSTGADDGNDDDTSTGSVPGCGNGILEEDEECDEGSETPNCNADCTMSWCGDGQLNATAGESCDDAGESEACNVDCTVASCGDGVLNVTAGESCDDANAGLTCEPGCVPCPLAPIYVEDFSNANGWTLDSEWEIGPAMASTGHFESCGSADPEFDHSSTEDNGVAGVVIGGNAARSEHPFRYLTSPIIDAGAYSTVQLELWRWLNSDFAPLMNNRIEVWDGDDWRVVWESGGSPGVADPEWTEVSYDISEHANAQMQIRIGFDVGVSTVWSCSSWNVDDIVVLANTCADR